MLDVHQAVKVKFTPNQPQNSSNSGYYTYICVYISVSFGNSTSLC